MMMGFGRRCCGGGGGSGRRVVAGVAVTGRHGRRRLLVMVVVVGRRRCRRRGEARRRRQRMGSTARGRGCSSSRRRRWHVRAGAVVVRRRAWRRRRRLQDRAAVIVIVIVIVVVTVVAGAVVVAVVVVGRRKGRRMKVAVGAGGRAQAEGGVSVRSRSSIRICSYGRGCVWAPCARVDHVSPRLLLEVPIAVALVVVAVRALQHRGPEVVIHNGSMVGVPRVSSSWGLWGRAWRAVAYVACVACGGDPMCDAVRVSRPAGSRCDDAMARSRSRRGRLAVRWCVVREKGAPGR